jgi:DNA-binding transcriptional LysR family regulator
MWRMVELSELRFFLQLVEHRRFRRAAEAVGVTSSRASQIVRSLEGKLGVELFHRTSRQVTLTAAGEALHAAIAGPHAALEAALEQAYLARTSIGGEMRLGLFSPSDAGPNLSRIIDAFERKFHGCRVVVLDLLQRIDGVEALLSGVVDVAACRLPMTHPEVVVGPTLAVEPRVLAVARDHPLAERTSISIEDVADFEVSPLRRGVRDEVVEAMVPLATPSGREIRRANAETLRRGGDDSLPLGPQHVMTLVARGLVVHPTVPSVRALWSHPDIVYVPIVDMPPSRTAIVHAKRPQTPTLRAFLDVAAVVLDSEEVDGDKPSFPA